MSSALSLAFSFFGIREQLALLRGRAAIRDRRDPVALDVDGDRVARLSRRSSTSAAPSRCRARPLRRPMTPFACPNRFASKNANGDKEYHGLAADPDELRNSVSWCGQAAGPACDVRRRPDLAGRGELLGRGASGSHADGAVRDRPANARPRLRQRRAPARQMISAAQAAAASIQEQSDGVARPVFELARRHRRA
jgi:hypothetical protein